MFLETARPFIRQGRKHAAYTPVQCLQRLQTRCVPRTCGDMGPGCSAKVPPGALPPLGRGGTGTDTSIGCAPASTRSLCGSAVANRPGASPDGSSDGLGRFDRAAPTSTDWKSIQHEM